MGQMIQKFESKDGLYRVKEFDKTGYWHLEVLHKNERIFGMASKDELAVDHDFKTICSKL